MPRHPPPGRGPPGSRRPMRDFFAAWLATLRSPLLPLLRRALSSTSSSGSWDDSLSSAATAVEAHWSALDAAARQDPAQVIAAGGWRSPLELPFLWLGDVHPSLLTSLLRTLSPSPRLLAAADRVDRRIRASVPAVSDRLRQAQEAFVSAEVASGADVEAFLEELKAVALEANRLRRGVLSELVATAGGYQAALFLEALSRFVLSMHDPEVLRRFDQCRPRPLASSSSCSQGLELMTSWSRGNRFTAAPDSLYWSVWFVKIYQLTSCVACIFWINISITASFGNTRWTSKW